MLKLKTGDPAKYKTDDSKGYRNVSFSRFVLPFAYSPVAYESKNGNSSPVSFFIEKPSEVDLEWKNWREKYFTHEVSSVLFHRTKWFKLNDDEKVSIDLKFSDCKENECIEVCMAAPSLVLFEFSTPEEIKAEAGSKTKAGKNNPMRNGFLLIDLFFPKQSQDITLDRLLQLNELFRYWQRPFEGHEDEKYLKVLGNVTVGFGNGGKLKDVKDPDNPDKVYFDRWAGFLEIPFKDKNGRLWRLFPEDFRESALAFIAGKQDSDPGWAIYADNRAFVWSCAITENGGNDLRKVFAATGRPWEFGHWIKLLNVDNPGDDYIATHQCRQFEKDWAEKRTYKRWEELGTFYGFTYHSGVLLGPDLNFSPISTHFRYMYFDMVILLLYIRVTLFGFGMELSRLSSLIDISSNAKVSPKKVIEWSNAFRDLRLRFTIFTNLYRFPLLSNQQQAVELYALAREHLDIEELFLEMQNEINISQEYLSGTDLKQQSNSIEILTVLTIIGLIMSLVTGFWGMNILVERPFCTTWYYRTIWVIGSFIGFIVLFLALIYSGATDLIIRKVLRRGR